MSTHHADANNAAKEARTYVFTLVSLLILTGITVGASYIQFGDGAANIVIALTIATIKAIIVALFFMHLLHDKPVNSIAAVAGFLFLGLLLLFTLLDIGSRDNLQPQNLKPPAPATATPAPAAEAPKE